MTTFKHAESTEWHPEYIEIMVWPYEYAPDESIIWPKGWPDTASETTRKRGDSFSIYLPFEHKQALIEFLNTRNEKGAVEINGKKWAVSTPTPFPHELPKYFQVPSNKASSLSDLGDRSEASGKTSPFFRSFETHSGNYATKKIG